VVDEVETESAPDNKSNYPKTTFEFDLGSLHGGHAIP